MATTVDSRVLVVNIKGGAEFTQINDAIKAAVDGDVVQVKMGQYDEVVVLDKNITVEAEPNIEVTDVLIAGGIVCTADGAVRNVGVTQMIDVRKGRVTLEGCDISMGVDGVRVCTGTQPHLLRCNIHGAQTGGDGVYFQEGAKGTVERCDIHSNRVNGIHVNGADVTLIQNRVHDCPYGIYFRRNARGTCDGNHVENVETFGIYVASSSDPVVTNNTISNCGVHGIMVSDNASGNIRDNTVNGGVRVLKGCAPTLGINNITGRIDNENVAGVVAPAGAATLAVPAVDRRQSSR
jgi:parallel beta-helix repeat protein